MLTAVITLGVSFMFPQPGASAAIVKPDLTSDMPEKKKRKKDLLLRALALLLLASTSFLIILFR